MNNFTFSLIANVTFDSADQPVGEYEIRGP